MTSPMTKTSICAICAQNGPTCCQLGQGQADFLFPLSSVEKEAITACDRWKNVCFTSRTSNSTRFISRLLNIFPNDLDKIQTLYPEHGNHEQLSIDKQGSCVFLGPMGCHLPEQARPLYCRLFPFWVIDGRVGFITFDLCLAQKGARSVNKVMKRLKMNNSQILPLYEALRKAWVSNKE